MFLSTTALLFAPFFSRPSFRALLFAPFFSRPSFRALLFAPISCLALCLTALLSCTSFCLADDPALPVTGHLSLYVNGTLQGTAECPSAWKAAGHTQLGRGQFGGQPTDFVTGLLGDARVYDNALSAAQIKALFASGPQTDWRLDHTQGAQGQADRSGPLSLSGADTSLDSGRSLLDTTRSYTVSAWVSLASTDGFQTFVSQDGKNLSGFYLQKRGDDGKFAFSIRGSDGPNPPQVIAESPLVPKTNTLYHLVGVFQAGNGPRGPVAIPTPEVTDTVPAASRVPWDAQAQGQFVQALTQDRQGRTYIATEGQGVWRYDPNAPAASRYTQFTTKDGLGSDDVYALLVDKKDRLWAGTLRGVSVYSGKAWKTYGPVEGVGGFRVFALASCPTTGDVWIATEGGLTRYLLAQDRWKQYGRNSGLPSDAVQALAFNARGDVFVGTQADGITISTAQSGYGTWKTVGGPLKPPHAPTGSGLPTSLINCLLSAKDGTLYTGTTAGLAHSSDSGKTWRFLRGADWSAKVDGEHPQAWLDDGLTEQADVRAIEVLPPHGAPVRISCGGAGTGDWGPDRFFDGGQPFHTDNVIDDTGLFHPAPQAVYQNARFGSFTYSIPHLPPGLPCRVRLFLAEVAFDHPGQRVFNVGLNGKRVLTHEDIFVDAGAKNKVILKEFVAQADASGHITLTFRGGVPLSTTAGHSPYELTEDYVTALAEDGGGHLLVGHRQTGLEVRDEATGRRIYPGPKDTRVADFVTSLVPQSDGTLLLGGYGDGLKQLSTFGGTYTLKPAPTPETLAALPTPAAPPTLAELNAMLKTVSAVVPDKDELTPHVVALQDDWLTQGDWLGRYGRYWACLNAICSPDDYQWGAGWDAVSYESQIGPHATDDDGLRYFVTELYTQNPRVLEMPPTYLDSRVKKGLTTRDQDRREAEIDDHGEDYPQSMDGPHIYTTLTVPAGLFTLSLYDYNKDAHGEAENRDRDYRVSIRPQPSEVLDDISTFEAQPELAHNRIRDFCGGVYKRFLVRGPVTLTVKVDRNNSRNTILPGMMLDLVDETPPPYFGSTDQWEEVQAHQEEQRQQAQSRGRIALFQPAATEQEAASRLLDTLGKTQFMNSEWWSADSRQFYAPLLRWYTYAAGHTPKEQQADFDKPLATCCYQMGQYQQWEEEQKRIGLTPARDVEKALRWDGVSTDGQGYQVVTDYLASKDDRKLSRR